MARPPWKRVATLAVKAAVAVAVLWFLSRFVARTWRDLRAEGRTIRADPTWLAVAGALYLAGLSACGVVYARVLEAAGAAVGLGAAIRAYLISHLGKYVPGKAMVVVMRVALTTPYGARASTAAVATFYETLAMMAAGALAASLGFALGPPPVQWLAFGASLALAVPLLSVVAPAVFPRIAGLVTRRLPDAGTGALPALSYRLLGVALLWSAAGWALLGLSQVAVIRALVPTGVPPAQWPVIVAGVALATVAGFVVAVLPGGLGVREGVLMAALGPAVGAETAVVSALALRLTWVGSEVVAGAVLAAVRPAATAATSPATTAPSPPPLPGAIEP